MQDNLFSNNQKYFSDENLQEINDDGLNNLVLSHQNNNKKLRDNLKIEKPKKKVPMDGKYMINPKNFFVEQINNLSDEYMPKIEDFVKNLVDLNKCTLCKQKYNIEEKMPRIMVHCGHTFCTECLMKFHKDYRVRCPLCLKLIRNIDIIERLPINHTIFHAICTEINKQNKIQKKELINIKEDLFKRFKDVCQRYEQPEVNFNLVTPQLLLELRQQQPPNPNNDFNISNLQMGNCQKHQDRIQHFYCAFHRATACRVCCEKYHIEPQCVLIELYDVEDVVGYLSQIWDLDLNQKDYNSENISENNEINDIWLKDTQQESLTDSVNST